MAHPAPSVFWLYPLQEDLDTIQLAENWTREQLSFSVKATSWEAFDRKSSTPIVEEIMTSPTAFECWMMLAPNLDLMLEYTKAINTFFAHFTPAILTGELHLCVLSCVMIASCIILVDKPPDFESLQHHYKDIDPNVTVFLTNFRAAVPEVQETDRRCNRRVVNKVAGTPRFVVKEALSRTQAGKQWPTEQNQSKISL